MTLTMRLVISPLSFIESTVQILCLTKSAHLIVFPKTSVGSSGRGPEKALALSNSRLPLAHVKRLISVQQKSFAVLLLREHWSEV